MRAEGIADAHGNRGEGRFVKDDLDSVEQVGRERGLCQIVANHLGFRADLGEVVFAAGAEIVDHADGMSVANEPRHEMGTNEACSARHQKSTHKTPL